MLSRPYIWGRLVDTAQTLEPVGLGLTVADTGRSLGRACLLSPVIAQVSESCRVG